MARVRRSKPFVITVLAAASMTSALACGGSTANDTGLGGGGSGNVSGSGGSGGQPSGCPASFPTNGTSCSLPSGTACNYGQGGCCPGPSATCTGGVWQGHGSSCNPPPPPPCPSEVPVDGSPCGGGGPCAGFYNYCTYGLCADGTNSIVAECNGPSWKVTKQKDCSPPACEGLSACECFDRPDCQALSEGCLCECDYNCPGVPPCVCACGGGTYLGCKPYLLD